MKVTIPVAFTPSMITSENVAEIYPDYAAGTTYAKDARVIYDNSTYVSLQAGNVGHQPDLVASTTWWVRYGPSNLFAMFDSEVNTSTTNASNITVTLATGSIDTIAFLNILSGTSIKITARSSLGGTIVYERETGLSRDNIIGWWEYFFTSFDYSRSTVVINDLPTNYPTMHVIFEIVGGTDLSVGQVTFGNTKDLGGTEYGASSGITDFSKVTVDDFGSRVFVKRNYNKRMNARLFIDNNELNRVHKTLTGLRATPALWTATDNQIYDEPLVIFGFYNDFTIEVSYPTASYCSLDIEGLI